MTKERAALSGRAVAEKGRGQLFQEELLLKRRGGSSFRKSCC
jgi:hypothetical protein